MSRLLAAALTGSHHCLDFLIGPGKTLDTNKDFVVDDLTRSGTRLR